MAETTVYESKIKFSVEKPDGDLKTVEQRVKKTSADLKSSARRDPIVFVVDQRSLDRSLAEAERKVREAARRMQQALSFNAHINVTSPHMPHHAPQMPMGVPSNASAASTAAAAAAGAAAVGGMGREDLMKRFRDSMRRRNPLGGTWTSMSKQEYYTPNAILSSPATASMLPAWASNRRDWYSQGLFQQGLADLDHYPHRVRLPQSFWSKDVPPEAIDYQPGRYAAHRAAEEAERMRWAGFDPNRPNTGGVRQGGPGMLRRGIGAAGRGFAAGRAALNRIPMGKIGSTAGIAYGGIAGWQSVSAALSANDYGSYESSFDPLSNIPIIGELGIPRLGRWIGERLDLSGGFGQPTASHFGKQAAEINAREDARTAALKGQRAFGFGVRGNTRDMKLSTQVQSLTDAGRDADAIRMSFTASADNQIADLLQAAKDQGLKDYEKSGDFAQAKKAIQAAAAQKISGAIRDLNQGLSDRQFSIEGVGRGFSNNTKMIGLRGLEREIFGINTQADETIIGLTQQMNNEKDPFLKGLIRQKIGTVNIDRQAQITEATRLDASSRESSINGLTAGRRELAFKMQEKWLKAEETSINHRYDEEVKAALEAKDEVLAIELEKNRGMELLMAKRNQQQRDLDERRGSFSAWDAGTMSGGFLNQHLNDTDGTAQIIDRNRRLSAPGTSIRTFHNMEKALRNLDAKTEDANAEKNRYMRP